jgi:ABC-type dipeptide/oligopeptide/nickel transport system permease subunit
MSAQLQTPAVDMGAGPGKPKSALRVFWSKFKRNKLAVIGLCFVIVLVLTAIFAKQLAPYPYDKTDYAATYQRSSWQHWMGTDELGRDLFSRLIWSLQNALLVAIGSQFIALVVGGLVGSVAGYLGGKVDNVLMRIVDIMFAFPSLLFNVILVSIFGRSIWIIFLAIGVTNWVGMARLVRAQVLAVKQREFIEAARALGATHKEIVLRYILPHTLGPIIVSLSFGIPYAMMIEGAMSVIGMGVAPPAPSFGVLISAAQGQVLSNPHLLFWPALCFAVTLLAFPFLGDGLRDALDPRD